jgi:hypothetical protein
LKQPPDIRITVGCLISPDKPELASIVLLIKVFLYAQYTRLSLLAGSHDCSWEMSVRRLGNQLCTHRDGRIDPNTHPSAGRVFELPIYFVFSSIAVGPDYRDPDHHVDSGLSSILSHLQEYRLDGALV